MSRIGMQPIPVPDGVKVSLDDGVFTARGPKGTVSQKVIEKLDVKIEEGVVTVERRGDSGTERSLHGLMRALLANAVHGVEKGFSKELQVSGVGYRAEVAGGALNLQLGFSHPVIFPIPEGIEIEVDKANKITVSGADRQAVGQVAAEIRALRKPDPYKAKGILYVGEVIRRKVGKAGAAAGAA